MALAALFSVTALGFAALGVWQVERRSWKLDLIARVESRTKAEPVAPPPASVSRDFDGQRFEYRQVRLTGEFNHNLETLVDASTKLGVGYWVITPLFAQEGTVLINRGFIPASYRSTYQRPQGPVIVTGLLRLTERDGRIFRPNKPKAGKWYSRDVNAIAKAKHMGPVAPYFVDANATGGLPIGGLTVVSFRNTHLFYALTWFALSALSAFGLWKLVKGKN